MRQDFNLSYKLYVPNRYYNYHNFEVCLSNGYWQAMKQPIRMFTESSKGCYQYWPCNGGLLVKNWLKEPHYLLLCMMTTCLQFDHSLQRHFTPFAQAYLISKNILTTSLSCPIAHIHVV